MGKLAAALTVLVLALLAIAARATPQVVSLDSYCPPSDPAGGACIGNWLAAGAGKDLYVPPGSWHYNRSFALASDTRIRCAGPGASVFKNVNPKNGSLFVTVNVNVENVVVENCGFDLNNGQGDFISVIGFNPASDGTNTNPRIRNIHVRGNRIFDSALKPGASSAKPRDAVLLLDCDGCWIEGNLLSGGARIKAGRPGERLFVRGNVIESGNDNAIAVPGRKLTYSRNLSSEIIIEGNVVVNPKVTGIFFGADGEPETDPALGAYGILVSGNHIRGDWTTACIQATLPALAGRIRIAHNTCTKSGTLGTGSGGSVAGIAVKRVNEAKLPSQQVSISSNTIGTELKGHYAMGGIAITGAHDGIQVNGNHVRNPKGDAAIHFKNMLVRDALVTDNVMTGTGLAIDGAFAGAISNNLVATPQGTGIRFATDKAELITASVLHNTVTAASGACLAFADAGNYRVDLVGNTLVQCAGGPLAGNVPASAMRLHNSGDAAPHAKPKRHLHASRANVTLNFPAQGTDSVNVTVPGARRGDIASAGFDAISIPNFHISAVVTGDDTVNVVVRSPIPLAFNMTGRVRVQVWKFE